MLFCIILLKLIFVTNFFLFKGAIFIPAVSPSFLGRDRLFGIAYQIVAYFNQSIFVQNIKIQIPIYIGTIPIQNDDFYPSTSSILKCSSFSSNLYRNRGLPYDRHTGLQINRLQNSFFKKETYFGDGPFYPFYPFELI